LLPANLQSSDCVSIKGLHSVASTFHQLRQYLLQILRSGAKIWDESEERVISEAERNLLLNLLMLQESLDSKRNKDYHTEGAARAKRTGRYTGRKKLSVDPNLFDGIAADFDKKKISENEALRRLGISRPTFYRCLKERRKP